MVDTPIMQVLKDPAFLEDAVRRIAGHFADPANQPDHINRKAVAVITSMSASLSRYSALSSPQKSYARDLIERHFLGLLAELAQGHKTIEDEHKASIKEYADNPQWGMF